jgi:biopolymer transport protein ExbD
MRFYTRRKKPLVINVVSLIDVLVLLLIFFIVSTKFKKIEPHVQINLPKSSTAESKDQKEEPIVIYATKTQQIFVEDKQIPVDRLSDLLKSKRDARPEASFVLKADKDVPLGFFVKVLDISKQAGLENLSLLTEPGKME